MANLGKVFHITEKTHCHKCNAELNKYGICPSCDVNIKINIKSIILLITGLILCTMLILIAGSGYLAKEKKYVNPEDPDKYFLFFKNDHTFFFHTSTNSLRGTYVETDKEYFIFPDVGLLNGIEFDMGKGDDHTIALNQTGSTIDFKNMDKIYSSIDPDYKERFCCKKSEY